MEQLRKTPLELVYLDARSVEVTNEVKPQWLNNQLLLGIRIGSVIFAPMVVSGKAELPANSYIASELEKKMILVKSESWDATVSVLQEFRIKFPNIGEINGRLYYVKDNKVSYLEFPKNPDDCNDGKLHMVCFEYRDEAIVRK